MEFNLEDAKSLVAAQTDYPVLYEDACRWATVSEQTAERVLKNEFEEGFDYIKTTVQTGKRGRPTNSWKLSLVCFNCFVVLTNEDPRKSLAIRQLLREALVSFNPKPTLNSSFDTSPIPPVDLPPFNHTSTPFTPPLSNTPLFNNNLLTLEWELKALSNYVHLKFQYFNQTIDKLYFDLNSLSDKLNNHSSALINFIGCDSISPKS
jgi:hypothetical protein